MLLLPGVGDLVAVGVRVRDGGGGEGVAEGDEELAVGAIAAELPKINAGEKLQETEIIKIFLLKRTCS